MDIIKRTGLQENYNRQKISSAIAAAFKSVHSAISEEQLNALSTACEQKILVKAQQGTSVSVELIQDIVEQTLMERNYYAEVKSYILYRENRTRKRSARGQITHFFSHNLLDDTLKSIQKDYDKDEYNLDYLYNKFFSFKSDSMSDDEKLSALIKAAVELTSQEAPRWEYIASRLLMLRFSISLKEEMEKHNIHSFYEKLYHMEEKGLYGSYILKGYSKEEIIQLERSLLPERDKLLTYSSLDLLLKRYVIRTKDGEPLETPQEMFMGIAMHLALKEENNRLHWVRKFYDVLSSLQVTMATPTMSNARKPFHQLSSCFIDTVPDSLDGIYRSIDNFAKVSKFGGGMGLYFGKVRASNSPIRGFQGAAGGVIRWIKLANDTAVAVDQLGVRQGAVAVYLDIWHKDILDFLQLRTNNGDDRRKAHDVFPAVCYPDLFWKTAKDNIEGNWYLMCPHEILTTKGYALEDCWGEEWEKRYLECVEDARISKRMVPIKELIRMIIKSAVETGTPFTFNRDHVNKMNPNSHKGVIYCSNLCTEIAQNTSAIELLSQVVKTVDGEEVVVQTTRPGNFVVCNLASLSLGKINVNDETDLFDTVKTTVRALDNVIDLNFYPVPYAAITNQKYRSIGLGVSGYHHMLALNNIPWETEKHLEFADKVFENINYAAVSASCELAAEKGRYTHFEGSDWETGRYFEKRDYNSPRWLALKTKVAKNGMRNAYLMAVAPTSTTSIIAGTTAGLDPIMNRYFLEEKKSSIVPRVAPDLSMATFWLYKSAHLMNQTFTVRACGVRQRHIDQAQSMNLYITNEFTFRQVLDLYLLAWEKEVKCIYYIRSKSLEVEECTSCSS